MHKSRAVVNGGVCDDRDTASLWSERAIFRRKMLSERPGHWAKLKHHFVPNVYLTELIYISLLGNDE